VTIRCILMSHILTLNKIIVWNILIQYISLVYYLAKSVDDQKSAL
jgi:hypothetical protein